MELTSKRFLIVGASGVLGNSLASLLMDSGVIAVGTATSSESAARLPAGLAESLLLDLEDQDSIDVLCNYLLAKAEQFDGIVFASGLVAFGSLIDTPRLIETKLFKVNALGPRELIRRLSPLLPNGSVVITLSGKIVEAPTLGLSAYGASKSALYASAQSAKRELARLGVTWLDARPGHTETGLARRAVFGQAPNFPAGLNPQAVAERILLAIKNDEKDLPSSEF